MWVKVELGVGPSYLSVHQNSLKQLHSASRSLSLHCTKVILASELLDIGELLSIPIKSFIVSVKPAVAYMTCMNLEK